MRARDVMTRELVAVTPSTHAKHAVELLVTNGFTLLPVLDGDRFAGVVGEADVLRDRIAVDARALVHPDWPAEPHGTPLLTVAEVMTTGPVVMGPDADAAEIAQVMLTKHLRAVPIVDGDRLVGIVTRRDLLRTIARADDAIARDVRQHLALCFRRGDRTATVDEGVVTLVDEYGDESERHIATIIAQGVPGVTGVRLVQPA